MLTTRLFAGLYDSTNISGRTRVNAAGLIVGVDFSATSNNVGTGAKTFTLTADLNVNRDWPVGGKVIAVDQVGGATMTGTVTTYTPSTQVLVLSIASVTGSGTGLTNWRIGSLDARRNFDPVTLQPTGLVLEGQATNLHSNSEGFNPSFTDSVTSALVSFPLTGKSQARRVTVNAGSPSNVRSFDGLSVANPGNRSIYVKSEGIRYVYIGASNTGAVHTVQGFDLQTGMSIGSFTQGGTNAPLNFGIQPAGGGFFRIYARTSDGATLTTAMWLSNSGGSPFGAAGTFSGTDAVVIAAPQLETASIPTSYNPTTTTQVTRTAEILDVNPTRLAELFRQGEGTIYGEALVVSNGTLLDLFSDANNGIALSASGTQINAVVTESGASQASLLGNFTAGQVVRFALTFNSNDFALSVNGADATTDTSGIVPIISQSFVGGTRANANNSNSALRKLGIRPNRISNANLKLLSAGSLDFFQNGEIL